MIIIIRSVLCMSFAIERQQRLHLQLGDRVHALFLVMITIMMYTGTQRPLTHSVYITITSMTS